jgi:gamma-butyrobetaine dioxygenase
MAEIRIVNEGAAPMLHLRDAQGERPLPALWLRARSPDPQERDEVTGQRLSNPHQLPEDLRLTGARPRPAASGCPSATATARCSTRRS